VDSATSAEAVLSSFSCNIQLMRILLANKFYYRRGGDCIYMLNLEQLLREHGHEVAVFTMDYPENIDTPWKKYFPREVKFRPGIGMIETLIRPFGWGEVRRKFSVLLDDFKPDVVHLNNIHTQLSPVIAEIAHKRGIRVVWTIHDLKLLCPRYDCLQNGVKLCEECFTDKRNVLRHNCMKNSRLASLIAYKEATTWNKERLMDCTDVFLCPSQFMADKMIQGGFNHKQVKVLCNFIDVEKCRRDNQRKEDYYCYIGRICEEKGVLTLLDAAKQIDKRLILIGDGPIREQMQGKYAQYSNIQFVGKKDWDEISEIVGKAKFTVLPSVVLENNPLTIIEAQCLGTPTLGANIGGIPELIDESNGMIFKSGNAVDLKDKIQKMFGATFDYESIAKQAQHKYSSDKYYKQIHELSNYPPRLLKYINDCYRKRYDYYCFIGRLSHEKGAATLIEAASRLPYKLVVIGDGPMRTELEQKATRNIEFVGFKQWDEIKEIVGKARFSVIPSEWYENNPLSVIEAQCLGTPVLGARIGGIPELITKETGMTFESRNADDLARKIENMWNATFDYKAIADSSLKRYNSDAYYTEIMKVYR